MSAEAPGEPALAAWALHLGAESEPARLRARLTEGTLPTALAEASSNDCNAPALTIDAITMSHGELDGAAARLGGWLVHRSIRPGDRVLVAGHASHGLLRAFLGVIRCGATAVPTDPGLTTAEMQRLVADCTPRAAFVDRNAAVRLGEIDTDLQPEVVVGLEPGAAATSVEDAGASPIGATETEAAPLLAYTSGTTGGAKGVPLSHANILSSLRTAMEAWRWDRDDVMVHALPLSHQHGLSGLIATLLSGSQAVIQPRFDPKSFCTLVAEHEATIVLAVPSIYERLSSWRRICTAPLRSLRLAVSGSAPLQAQLAERVGTWLGELPLERYGSTEAGLVLSNLYEGPRRAGSVGYALPGVEVRIAGEDGRVAAPGEDGEVQVRGPQVFAGYRERAEATAEAFTGDGWFRSGDVGRVDPADGSTSITGRIKEMIITGGLNVFPGEVEAALDGAPGVAGAAVAGVPSERWGEEVVAFAVAAQGAEVDPAEVIAYCRERLSPHKCPKRVFQLAELPTNKMGKVRRDQLASIAIERRDRSTKEN